MDAVSYQRAASFYEDVITVFGARYPRLLENRIGMIKVLHAFDDKLPLVDILLKRDLLSGVVLKKSSSEAQGGVVQFLESRLAEHDILMARSDTLYANAVPSLSPRMQGRGFIIGDHGGYYAHALPSLTSVFGAQLAGITEHTLNGEERVLRQFGNTVPVNYFSTARVDLKSRSDRDIAYAIANEIMSTADRLGQSLSNENATVLLVGYGTMGCFAAQKLKQIGCKAELVVTDISDKKLAFAVQDDHLIARDMDEVLTRANMVVLATDVIKGKTPVLGPRHFAMLKDGACIASMTSLDDEAGQDNLAERGIINRIGAEGPDGVYRGPAGKTFFLMRDGRPANVGLMNGGAGDSIYMVEAAGLAGAFVVAQNGSAQAPRTLSDEDGDIIAGLWLKHFYNPETMDSGLVLM